MNVRNLFRSKKFWRIFVIALALIVCVVSVLAIMLPSYADYRDYYDGIMREREHQKYLDSLPLEFLGISAELSDSVVYYDNGKAAPVNDDFSVMAHFTERGKNFDEKLSSSAFDIDVPEDFAENGGTVTVSYAYTPEATAGDGEETPAAPDPIVKTTDVEIALEPVRLAQLSVKEQPYRVAYSDEMSFDTDGMTAVARYNDGTTLSLVADDLSADPAKLKAGATAAQVTYSDGVSSVSADVAVTVVPAADYTDGRILALAAEGTSYLAEGDALSSASPTVRASYANGNRLLLDADSYSVTGNVETASFMKNCIVTVALNEDPSVYCKTAVGVRNGIEAEDATVTGGTTETVEGYSYDGTAFEPVGSSTVVENAEKISFVIQSAKVARTDFSMRIANRTVNADGDAIVPIGLSDVIGLKVNGRMVPVYRSSVLGGYPIGEEERTYVFHDIRLPDLVLNSGTNTVELTFDLSASDGVTPSVAVDRLDISTMFEGKIYESVDECLLDEDDLASLDVEKVYDWSRVGNRAYGHALCTDGTYLYSTHTSWATGGVDRQVLVSKFDPRTNELVATSALTEKAVVEQTAGITYYDGKIILFRSDGSCLYTEASAFADGCTFAPYDGFSFEGVTGVSSLRDVYYNAAEEKFAVFYGTSADGWATKIGLFDREMSLIRTLEIYSDTAGSVNRLTGSNDYIYVNHSKDGVYTPVLHIYDWEGNYLGRSVIPNTLGIMGDVIADSSKTNTQGIAALNGELYFLALKFGTENGSDMTAYFHAAAPGVSEDRELSLNFGEYLAACADGSYTPAFAVNPASGTVGKVGDSTGGYSMGGCSDGEYLYVSLNTNGNANNTVYKLDPVTYEVVAKSAAFHTGASSSTAGDNAQLFIKDGVLYCFAFDSKVYSVALDRFAANCVLTETTVPFDEVTKAGGVLKGAFWSDAAGRYAVVDTSSNMVILDEDGNALCEPIALKDNIAAAYRNMKVTSVTGDDKYIYVAYSVNNQTSVPFGIYTWDGEFVGTGAPDGIHLAQNVNGVAGKNQAYNIQGIFFHDGELYATICTWENPSGLYLWKVGVDNSVFGL